MCRGRREHREASPAKSQKDISKTNISENDASEADASQVGEALKEAQREAPKKRRRNSLSRRDDSEVTCYHCNNKGYYAKYCTEPKD